MTTAELGLVTTSTSVDLTTAEITFELPDDDYVELDGSEVSSLALSGELLAIGTSAGTDGTAEILLWSTTGGELSQLSSTPASSRAIASLAFDDSGLHLFSFGSEGEFARWAIAEGGDLERVNRVEQAHDGEADIVITADGMSAITAGTDRRARQWRIGDQLEQVEEWELGSSAVDVVALEPLPSSDDLAAVAIGDGTIQLLERDGTLDSIGLIDGLTSVDALRGGSLVAGGTEGLVALDRTGQVIDVPDVGPDAEVTDVLVWRGDLVDVLVVGHDDSGQGSVSTWVNAEGTPTKEVARRSGRFDAVAIAPDGSMIVAGQGQEIFLNTVQFEVSLT